MAPDEHESNITSVANFDLLLGMGRHFRRSLHVYLDRMSSTPGTKHATCGPRERSSSIAA